MNFVDTHTHLYEPDYDADRDETVKRALDADVTTLILPDVSSKSRAAMFDMAAAYPGTAYPCIGLHPTEINDGWRDEIDIMMESSTREDIVGIGETGMDLHWSRDYIKEQEEAFRIQIELAIKRDLPLIIHTREATEITLKILEDYRGRGLRGVFHAYSGSIETFRELERLGDFYVGIGGVVTFKNASIAETVKEIPLEKILTETDAPWLAPTPYRGTRNESSHIPLIAQKIAVQKGIDIEKVAKVTTENAHRLFSI